MAINASNLARSLWGFASLVTLTAASLMLGAHQTATYTDHTSVHVGFGDLAPYWCFVFANYMASAYGALLVCLPTKSQLWQLIVALDTIMLVILSSSCSAALATGLIERNGNIHARWEPIFPMVPSYCLRVLFASGIGFVGVLIYLCLLLRAIQAEFNSILVDI